MSRLYRPLVVLTALAVAIRVVVMLAYSSAVFVYYNGDALRYARVSPAGGHLDLFSDRWVPAGYAIFLAAVREIWSALAFTIGLQHLLGVATGLLFSVGAWSLWERCQAHQRHRAVNTPARTSTRGITAMSSQEYLARSVST